MPYKYIIRSCGHKERVWLQPGEVNDPAAIQYHSEEICLKCYKVRNPVYEKKMDYMTYKTEYHDCRTKPGSYDDDTKTISVYVPIK